ncbi:MAG: GIY-YIG nuclease family protein [Patescibacteria group bacterium]
MFFLYILGSLKDHDLYVGSTNDLKKRLEEHNLGKVRSTKSRRPFKLLYYEAYSIEEEARNRESSLKLRGQARNQLLKRIGKTLELFQNKS